MDDEIRAELLGAQKKLYEALDCVDGALKALNKEWRKTHNPGAHIATQQEKEDFFKEEGK